MENLTNDTPPKKGFWTPLVRYVFHPPQLSVLCFSCTKIHDSVDQKLFWRGPKIFGRACSLVRFPPPIRFAPPHITGPSSLAVIAPPKHRERFGPQRPCVRCVAIRNARLAFARVRFVPRGIEEWSTRVYCVR